MSGAGRKTIYKDMKTGAWPNGLTVDHFEKRIVWTDARFKYFFSFLFYNLHQIILTKLKCVFLCMYHVCTLKLVVNFICFCYDTFFWNLPENQVQDHKNIFTQFFLPFKKYEPITGLFECAFIYCWHIYFSVGQMPFIQPSMMEQAW